MNHWFEFHELKIKIHVAIDDLISQVLKTARFYELFSYNLIWIRIFRCLSFDIHIELALTNHWFEFYELKIKIQMAIDDLISQVLKTTLFYKLFSYNWIWIQIFRWFSFDIHIELSVMNHWFEFHKDQDSCGNWWSNFTSSYNYTILQVILT
jgi:hypothetical protein